MKINSDIEVIDKSSGQVLPRIEVGNRVFFGRHVPIGTRVSFLEDRRVAFNNEPFNTSICFSSVPIFKDMELSEYIKQYNVDMFKQKSNANRIKLSSLQRNDSEREKLEKNDVFKTFEIFIGSGVENVPIELPLDYDLNSWKNLKKDAASILSPKQKLVADLHCFQDHNNIKEILKFEIDEGSKYFLMTCRTVNDSDNLASYGQVWDVLRKLKEGDNVPIIVGKDVPRYQISYGNIASTSALNFFNIGVVAERLYMVPSNIRKRHNTRKPDKYYLYDPEEASFVNSEIQEFLNKKPLVRQILQNNNLMQGVSPYEAMLCSNFVLQQEDSFLQNSLLANGKSFSDIVQEKTQWSSFYKNCVKPYLSGFN